MKRYPSIPREAPHFKAHVFDKLDGSNLRFEWTRKKGWGKYGTRRRLFDSTDDVFGKAIDLFHNGFAEKLHDISKQSRWESAVFFLEFWGENSLAGVHEPNDEKFLTLFDVAPYKKGLISPQDFRKLFENSVTTPKYLGHLNWGPQLISDVRENILPGVTFEGIVGKSMRKNKIIMAKAKTKIWLDAIRFFHTAEKAQKIISS